MEHVLFGRRPTGVARVTLLTLSIASCSGRVDRSSRVAATVDTLPGGILRVNNTSPADSGRWSLVLERTVQPPDDSPGVLRNPDDILLLDDGSLLVADSKPTSIMRFDARGQFVGTIGRDGNGPGEYRSAYLAARGDTLVVHDAAAARAVMFSLASGAVLTQRSTTPRYFSRVIIDGAGRAVVPMSTPPDSTKGPRQAFMRFSLNGRTLDTVMLPERPKGDRRWLVRDDKRIIFEMLVPFQARDIHAPDPFGGFVTGWSGNYTLRTTRNGHDTVRLIHRQWNSERVRSTEKAALVSAKIIEMKEQAPMAALRSGLVESAIPDERPAFEQLTVDRAGRIWVRLSQGDSNSVHFDLFDRQGQWLDMLVVPQSGWNREWWHPVSFGNDRVAVVREDAEGRPGVLVYRVVRRD